MLFEKGLVQSFVKYHYNFGTFFVSICNYLLLHDRISYSVHIYAFAHVVHVAFSNEGCGEKHSRTGSDITNEEGCKSFKRTLQLQPKILLWS